MGHMRTARARQMRHRHCRSSCCGDRRNLNIDVLGDVVAAINKFSNLACAPKKTRIDIAPGTVNFKIDIGGDVLGLLGAFAGAPYSVPLPADPCTFGRAP